MVVYFTLIIWGIIIGVMLYLNDLLAKERKAFSALSGINEDLVFDLFVSNMLQRNLAIDLKYTKLQKDEIYTALMAAGKQLDKQAKTIIEQQNLINYYKNKDDENTLRLAQRN